MPEDTEYYCPSHTCVVTSLPCPHCGSDDHKEFGGL